MAIEFRPAESFDIAAMAAIRAREWESKSCWKRVLKSICGSAALCSARSHAVPLWIGIIPGKRLNYFCCAACIYPASA